MAKLSEKKRKRAALLIGKVRDRCMEAFKTRRERRACVMGASAGVQLAAGIFTVKMGS